MPHPFHPDDFPLNEDVYLEPTKVFYVKGGIHFKTDAHIYELTGKLRKPFDDFSSSFQKEAAKVAQRMSEGDEDRGQEPEPPKYTITSSGSMMRTLKTMVDKNGEKVCDLNMTFVSFDNSTVRFPSGSEHSRHDIEMYPVDDKLADKHEAFIRHSIPYFWDLTGGGQVGYLHKCLNQKRCEIGQCTPWGMGKDLILALNDDELDEVVALSTCMILLNGRSAMDH